MPLIERMIFNVSRLLNGFEGDTIEFHFAHESLEHAEVQFREVEAQGRLMRTDRTVLAEANVKAVSGIECARCLEAMDAKIELNFAEEFRPDNSDLVARRPIWDNGFDELEDVALAIDESNVLDMSEVLGQCLFSAIPMRPLCREYCQGLCGECWQNLNARNCECVACK